MSGSIRKLSQHQAEVLQWRTLSQLKAQCVDETDAMRSPGSYTCISTVNGGAINLKTLLNDTSKEQFC